MRLDLGEREALGQVVFQHPRQQVQGGPGDVAAASGRDLVLNGVIALEEGLDELEPLLRGRAVGVGDPRLRAIQQAVQEHTTGPHVSGLGIILPAGHVCPEHLRGNIYACDGVKWPHVR